MKKSHQITLVLMASVALTFSACSKRKPNGNVVTQTGTNQRDSIQFRRSNRSWLPYWLIYNGIRNNGYRGGFYRSGTSTFGRNIVSNHSGIGGKNSGSSFSKGGFGSSGHGSSS